MIQVFTKIDSLLRGNRLLNADEIGARGLLRLAGAVVLFGMFYGAVMGTFSVTSPDRAMQIVYSAIKVPMLLLITFITALPSFFVMNTLAGTRSDFRVAVESLISTQAVLTIVLASFAPFTALWYCSYGDYGSAILFNAAMFGVASFTAQVTLRRLYRPLIQRNPRHRMLLIGWLVVYVFVGIQMGWILRPFVGSPFTETRFFREDAFSNAYVFVGRLIGGIFQSH